MAGRTHRAWLPIVGLAVALEAVGAWAISVVQVTYSVTGSGSCGEGCFQWYLVGTPSHPYLVAGVGLVVAGAVAALAAFFVRRRGRLGRLASAGPG